MFTIITVRVCERRIHQLLLNLKKLYENELC